MVDSELADLQFRLAFAARMMEELEKLLSLFLWVDDLPVQLLKLVDRTLKTVEGLRTGLGDGIEQELNTWIQQFNAQIALHQGTQQEEI